MKFDEFEESFSNRLNYAMSIRGMNQADLIIKTGIPSSSLSQYVNGHVCPKQDRLFKLAEALSVDEAWLMGYPVQMDKAYKKEERPDLFINADAKYIIEMYNNLSVKNKLVVKQLMESLSE